MNARTGVIVMILAALLGPRCASGQSTVLAEGRNLADWLGLESGRPLHFETEEGGSVCAVVGPDRHIDGRWFVPLFGLPWPGLATDSQVLVPLDGALEVDVIRTPGPRPRIDALIESPGEEIPYLGELTAWTLPESLTDGWYAFGIAPEEPNGLLHVSCSDCNDAGQRVWMERDRGITRIEVMTIVGGESLELVDEPCTPPEVEIRFYIEPNAADPS